MIINGCCLEYMSKMEDESVDLIVTDPPYLISYKTNHRKDKSHEFCSTISNDDNYNHINQSINVSEF